MSDEVQRDVEAVAAAIVKALDGRVRSLVWHGGFARGEGGMYAYRGRRLPLGDYDFEAVCDVAPDAGVRERVARALETQFGYRSVTLDPAPTLVEDAECFNIIDIKYTTPAAFHQRPADLATYDFIHSSRVLHGEDLRDGIRISLDAVSPISPFRILNNRLLAMLPVGGLRLWRGEGAFQEYVAHELALVRVALDLAVCLTFLMGCYAPSHAERLKRLRARQADLEREVTGDTRAMLDFIEAALERKQHPRIAVDGAAARVCWFETWRHAWSVLGWMGWRLMLSPNAPPRVYARLLQARLPGRFYRAYLEQEFVQRGWPLAHTAAGALARLPNVYEHLAWRGAGFCLRHPLAAWRSPAVRAAGAVPLVLAALHEDGKVDSACLKDARDLVSLYDVGFPIDPTPEAWDAAREAVGAVCTRYRNQKGAFRTLRASRGR